MDVVIPLFRAYVTRSAIWNTLILALIVQAATVPLALLLAQRLRKVAQSQSWLLLCIVWPLLFDLWVWRLPSLVAPIWLADATTAVLVLLLAYSIRLLPLLIALAAQHQPATPSSFNLPYATLALLLLVNAYHVLVNTSIPLLITGGYPLEETFTLISWAYQQMWVNGDWTGALLLATPLVMEASLIVWLISNYELRITHDESQVKRSQAQWIVPVLLTVWPYITLLITGIARSYDVIDGRWPLWIGSGLGTSLLVFWLMPPRSLPQLHNYKITPLHR